MEHDRIVALDGPLNFRDIGGYKNNKGQHVKWNKIYRSVLYQKKMNKN